MESHRADVYVITGGGGGMGRAVAIRLRKKGIILLSDIISDGMEKVAAELSSQGFRVETQLGDITDKDSVQSLANTVSSLGRLAGLVHTAGISPTMSDWKRMFEVDLIGTVLLLEGFLPLAESGTAAVCVASMAAYLVPTEPETEVILSDPMSSDFIKRIEPCLSHDNPAGHAYSLAKRGVILLCKNMSLAWGERGARIVSLSPGIIDTPMGRKEMEENSIMQYMLEQTPLKRMGKPEDIASAVDFLLSENASFMTGTDLLVDGGVVAALMRSKPSSWERRSPGLVCMGEIGGAVTNDDGLPFSDYMGVMLGAVLPASMQGLPIESVSVKSEFGGYFTGAGFTIGVAYALNDMLSIAGQLR